VAGARTAPDRSHARLTPSKQREPGRASAREQEPAGPGAGFQADS